MTTAPTELKACPFCGGESVIKWVDGKPWFFPACTQCGARGPTYVASHGATEAEAIAAWNTRTPAVGGVRVKPLWMADMLSRNAGNTEGAPAWIRVAQDGEGMHGGFWTCAAATENSPQYIRADLVRKALEPQAVDDAMVERGELSVADALVALTAAIAREDRERQIKYQALATIAVNIEKSEPTAEFAMALKAWWGEEKAKIYPSRAALQAAKAGE